MGAAPPARTVRLRLDRRNSAAHSTLESHCIKTIGSLKKLDDFPLYTVYFYGDYALTNYAPEVST